MKVTTYPGMHLGSEVRESISLDEDDLSDVEDEVFIRDGKNGYKLAEELNVKRPLMAPRRKPKPDISSRLRNKPPCRAFCKPCCYVFLALSILIGLIVLVVVLVSIIPLPLDRLRDWIIKRSRDGDESLIPKLMPCNNLKVRDVWSVNLPKLTTESPVRLLDVNNDGFQDIIFGFGTGDNYNVIGTDTFCPIFLGVPSPCDGGVIALNGLNGDILWRHWLNDTIFHLHCTADINGDSFNDCLAVGSDGTITIINSRNGSAIWQINAGTIDVLVANFIPDQNNDNISDILTSFSSLEANKEGSILLLSGKNGEKINIVKTPNGAKSFYMPQLLTRNDNKTYVLIGTGSPTTSGNLTAAPIEDFVSGNLENATTLYQDHAKGLLTQSVLVDITGDKIQDIVTAMYNSTVVAINGATFFQIWNFTIQGGETYFTPIPGYFNADEVPDFLVIYQSFDSIFGKNYTQTFILDGKNGKSIYKPIGNSVITQMNGVLLSAEGYGFDTYLFWTSECQKYEGLSESSKENSPICNFHLNALNQFHQPPGVLVYNSVNRSNFEFNNTKSVLKHIRDYSALHQGQSEIDEQYNNNGETRPSDVKKIGSFRHKENRNGKLKEYILPNEQFQDDPKYYNDELEDSGLVNVYNEDEIDNPNFYMQEPNPYTQENNVLLNSNIPQSNRDPRSKEKKVNSAGTQESKSKKKNLSDKKHGIYSYLNIKNSGNRLLTDLNNLPTDILRDTYIKNEERRLKKSKFEQRDINSHRDKIKENKEIKRIINEEKKAMQNMSLHLWDLESEKEIEERENNAWRGKREVSTLVNRIRKISSVGAVLNPLNTTSNSTLTSIDVIFIIYWMPEEQSEKAMLKDDLEECIKEKMQKVAQDDSIKTTLEEQREIITTACRSEQSKFIKKIPFFDRLHQLRLGQMTVYRMNIECECGKLDVKKETCANFLPSEYQSWPEYLGKRGDGIFLTRKARMFQ